MREGYNPNKDKNIHKTDCFHQVIIPVYIPNQEGYFKDSFKILDYCLQSLFKTSHQHTYFTIVNNGSCTEVITYLDTLLQQKKIHELIHTTNIGKLNAVLKGIVGQRFQLVTITDADVLFLNNWQKKTYEVFEAFPKAGAVCPTPSSKSFNDKTYNILFEKLFSKNLYFTDVLDQDALRAFAHSIGNDNFYKKAHLQKYLVVANGKVKAVVGAGHFVTTYRFEVFKKITVTYSEFALGGLSENLLLDNPVVKNGLWRLSTQANCAYHLGNVLESWMSEVMDTIEYDLKMPLFNFPKEIKSENKCFLWIKNDLFAIIFYRKAIRRWFLQYKGLSKNEANDY
ncbi:glycosyltransferase [Flavobacterium restrictum]|uniref:Glycosyltransferase family 2 protein n=1 Tax=Flavobacterium restrictum TaxID=2594428 RepID=A0A553E875_9FLAO|nr:glycosyltransferase [Flavobacterium restrictum]TRX41249.1 glycosyltransferase family 2 protein [Flavobacterium restrictum]